MKGVDIYIEILQLPRASGKTTLLIKESARNQIPIVVGNKFAVQQIIDQANKMGEHIPEFFEMVDELEKRLEYDKKNTSLPEKPNYKEINEFVASVNERVVKGEI